MTVLNPLTMPRIQYGPVYEFSQLFFFASGTDNPLATYSQNDGDVSHLNANPLIADENGVFGPIFMLAAAYKVVLATAEGVIVWTQDGVHWPSFVIGESVLNPITDYGASTTATIAQNKTAIDAAIVAGPGFVPIGVYPVNYLTGGAIPGRFSGLGQLKDTEGPYKRGREFTNITAAPSSHGDEGNIQTAFNGDWSKTSAMKANPFEFHMANGVIGTPAVTGYVYYPELCPDYSYSKVAAGYNGVLPDGGGRTGLNLHREVLNMTSEAQGDWGIHNALVQVDGYIDPMATSFIQAPAGFINNGDVTASRDGVYLQGAEYHCSDQGFDVASIGLVWNGTRTNNTGDLGCAWIGTRVQQFGSKALDVAWSASGSWRAGWDLSQVTLASSGALIKAAGIMKSGDRIYGNAPGTSVDSLGLVPDDDGNAWFGFDTNEWLWIVNGGTALALLTDKLVVPGGCLSIKSAQTAPTATASLVHIYMDTADGKLKYRLPDGTVRIITYT